IDRRHPRRRLCQALARTAEEPHDLQFSRRDSRAGRKSPVRAAWQRSARPRHRRIEGMGARTDRAKGHQREKSCPHRVGGERMGEDPNACLTRNYAHVRRRGYHAAAAANQRTDPYPRTGAEPDYAADRSDHDAHVDSQRAPCRGRRSGARDLRGCARGVPQRAAEIPALSGVAASCAYLSSFCNSLTSTTIVIITRHQLREMTPEADKERLRSSLKQVSSKSRTCLRQVRTCPKSPTPSTQAQAEAEACFHQATGSISACR